MELEVPPAHRNEAFTVNCEDQGGREKTKNEPGARCKYPNKADWRSRQNGEQVTHDCSAVLQATCWVLSCGSGADQPINRTFWA